MWLLAINPLAVTYSESLVHLRSCHCSLIRCCYLFSSLKLPHRKLLYIQLRDSAVLNWTRLHIWQNWSCCDNGFIRFVWNGCFLSLWKWLVNFQVLDKVHDWENTFSKETHLLIMAIMAIYFWIHKNPRLPDKVGKGLFSFNNFLWGECIFESLHLSVITGGLVWLLLLWFLFL